MTEDTQSAAKRAVVDDEDASADDASPATGSSQPGHSDNEDLEPLTDRALVPVNVPAEPEGNWFSRFLMQIGLRSKGSLRDDLHEALSNEGQAGNVFSPEERAMLRNILRLRELRVDDVMVQRAEMEAVDAEIKLGELLQVFETTGHSRLPVYGENLDDPRGMVLVKDLLLHFVSRSKGKARGKNSGPVQLDIAKVNLDVPLSAIDAIRTVIFVPPSMLAADLMARMQATRTQMALVIDEYGGTDGLVTLEDIVEEVVGEIEDEHDDEEDVQIIEAGEGVWSVDAATELEDVIAALGEGFDPGDLGEDVDTLGGLVYALAGHIPVRGEVVRGMTDFEFRIIEADPRRIKRLQIVHTIGRAPRRKGGKGDPIGVKSEAARSGQARGEKDAS